VLATLPGSVKYWVYLGFVPHTVSVDFWVAFMTIKT